LLANVKRVQETAGGTTQQNLLLKDLRAFKIALPKLEIQKEQVKLLKIIDSKIALNNQINSTLEAVGEAFFKRWFVDFVFPNEEGKPYKSSGGEMVDNEKFGKETPYHWKVGEITEVALIVDCLHSKKPRRIEAGPILLQVFNIDKTGYLDLTDSFNVSEKDYSFWTRNIELKGGDCIITNVGRVGALAQIPEGCHFGIGRNITAIRPTKISPTYLINYLISKYGTTEIQKNVDNGTILDSLNVKGIIRIKILIPPVTILNKYDNLARILKKLIEVNNSQAATLSKIRDILLPKLMSGKIRVPIGNKMERQ
jgi:type I restriction enzyme S subunit